MRNKKQKGFTLIELLVVIAIIGLLASVVLLALNSARAKSRDAKRIADVRQLASAMELFFNDLNSYPTRSYGVTPVKMTTGDMTTSYMVPAYIGQIPTSPTPADTGCTGAYGIAANVANDYQYSLPSGPVNNLIGSYTLTFCLGAVTGGYTAGVHTLTPAGIQ